MYRVISLHPFLGCTVHTPVPSDHSLSYSLSGVEERQAFVEFLNSAMSQETKTWTWFLNGQQGWWQMRFSLIFRQSNLLVFTVLS